MNWITLAQITLPAGFALLGSYLAIRSQVKLKSIETEAQTTLKAKELIFSTYQKRWEKADRDSTELLALTNQFNEKMLQEDMGSVTPIFAKLLAHQMTALNEEDLNSLVAELKEAGIADKHQRKIEIVNEYLSKDLAAFFESLKNLPNDEALQRAAVVMHDLVKTLAVTSAMHGFLLQKKAEDLFSGHINSGALLKK